MRAIAVHNLTRMETLMGAAFRSFFAFVVGLFSVMEKTVKAAENIADVAVATSGAYKDQAEADRAVAADEAEAARLVRELKVKQALKKIKDAAAAANQQNQPQP